MEKIAIFVGQSISYVSRAFNLGAGATWPGEIVLRIDPHILSKLLSRITKGIIIVAGTNGKTTTSLMIKNILTDQGLTVLHNASGANLLNGIVSSFLTDSRNTFDYAVFEVDENVLTNVLRQVTMSRGQNVYVVLLNLFRDQLDRYGEVDTIAKNWITSFEKLDKETTVLINGDDPQLAFIGARIHAHVLYFGLDDKKYYLPKMQHAIDTIFCPSCGNRLTFTGVYFSHLGDWKCTQCGFTHPKSTITSSTVTSPLEGVYNTYNALAATLASETLGIYKRNIENSLKNFLPAFGRMEDVRYEGKHIKILLSKNPTGCNESLRTVLSSKQKGPLMLLLNDRIPDGTDVSWIWDVDFEQLDGYLYPITVSGDRYLDLALRIKYGVKKYELRVKNKNIGIEKDLKSAVEKFTEQIKEDETGWVLVTYSAMLDVRKILTGKKIL